MYLLFEENAKFLTGRLLSETDTSAQVEQGSGKRVKIKSAYVLLRFDQPAPDQLLAAAQSVSAVVDLALAWEFAPEDDFGFADLAREYFSAQPTLPELAGMLLALHSAPHYFRRAGRGRYRKASSDTVALALAAIEKKKQMSLQIDDWALALGQGQCPQQIRDQLYRVLFKPDKNAPEYKAVVVASRATHLGPLELLKRAGAIESPYQFHWKHFLLENFAHGTGFAPMDVPSITDDLPISEARAFSIDDSNTTEIDDALSVLGLGTCTVVLGIHIAAPALAITPGSAVDQAGRNRLSTVYMPGHKLTMLPDTVIQKFTLAEGQHCPSVSLYVTIDAATLEIKAFDTRLDRVWIEANLRHDQLGDVVTPEWLENPAFAHESDLHRLSEQRERLSFLYRLAQHLKTQREQVRGKPETFNRPDYDYRLNNSDGSALDGKVPDGSEQVQISVRPRGAPLDLIVAEAMILANSTWGGQMAALGVPAIYRSQASMAPGVKVRMGTRAMPHAGLGVKHYAWSTSPLRRYTDLVNQWQIIACAKHGPAAALAAPFKAKDAQLFAIIQGFDAAYSDYRSFQNAMERYWVLKYIQQTGISEIETTLFKDNLARADHLPLVLPVAGSQGLARGCRLLVRLGDIDLVALDVCGTLVARLDTPSESPGADSPDSGEDLDDDLGAGPITIAVDISESNGADTDTGIDTADAVVNVTAPSTP